MVVFALKAHETMVRAGKLAMQAALVPVGMGSTRPCREKGCCHGSVLNWGLPEGEEAKRKNDLVYSELLKTSTFGLLQGEGPT